MITLKMITEIMSEVILKMSSIMMAKILLMMILKMIKLIINKDNTKNNIKK